MAGEGKDAREAEYMAQRERNLESFAQAAAKVAELPDGAARAMAEQMLVGLKEAQAELDAKAAGGKPPSKRPCRR